MLDFVPRTHAELAQAWPPTLDHISASSLKTFMRCPEQWRRRYCLGERAAPYAAAIQGRADHAALQTNFAVKRDTGQDLPLDDVLTEFSEVFDREIEASGGPEEVDWGKDITTPKERSKAAGQVKDAGVGLVRVYREQVCGYILPLEVEPEFALELEGLPVRVDGRLDLIALDTHPLSDQGELGSDKIIERKTQTRAKVSPETRFQAQLYQLAYKLPVHVHSSLKRTVPEVIWADPKQVIGYDQRKAQRIFEQAQKIVGAIGHCYQAYGPDQPWPGALTHDWSCNFCSWRPTC